MVKALACVKQACAQTNQEFELLDGERASAIVKACEEIRGGKLRDQFVVDVIQGGAGTSTNMNANEVIANRALEIMGHEFGEYKFLHPLEQVNLSQSTNDVYPTAVKVALHFEIDLLIEAMEVLRISFAGKAAEFKDVLKMGRTQMQDAVPMTLGQEFSAELAARTGNSSNDTANSQAVLLKKIWSKLSFRITLSPAAEKYGDPGSWRLPRHNRCGKKPHRNRNTTS